MCIDCIFPFVFRKISIWFLFESNISDQTVSIARKYVRMVCTLCNKYVWWYVCWLLPTLLLLSFFFSFRFLKSSSPSTLSLSFSFLFSLFSDSIKLIWAIWLRIPPLKIVFGIKTFINLSCNFEKFSISSIIVIVVITIKRSQKSLVSHRVNFFTSLISFSSPVNSLYPSRNESEWEKKVLLKKSESKLENMAHCTLHFNWMHCLHCNENE